MGFGSVESLAHPQHQVDVGVPDGVVRKAAHRIATRVERSRWMRATSTSSAAVNFSWTASQVPMLLQDDYLSRTNIS